MNKIFFVVILLLQLAIFFFWTEQKGNYYWDEYFTFLAARDVAKPGNPDEYPSYNIGYKYDCWTKDRDMLNEFVVSRNETTILDDGIENISKQFIKNPYAVLVNIGETIIPNGELNKWAGICWNLLFFLGIQFVIYCITKNMGFSEEDSIFAMCLYGFSGMAISMVTFVRQYMLSTFFVLVIVYAFLLLYKKLDTLKSCFGVVCVDAILLWLFFVNPLVGILFCGVVCGLLIALIRNRRIRELVCFFSTNIMVGGGALLFSPKLRFIVFPSHDMVANNRILANVALFTNLKNIDLQAFIARTRILLQQIYRYQFGDKFVTLIFFFLLSVCLLYYCCNRKNEKDVDKHIYDTNKICILTIALVFFALAGILFDYVSIERYIAIAFPIFAIVLAYIFCYLFNMLNIDKVKKRVFLLLTVVIIAFCTNLNQRVAYVYPEDKRVINKIEKLSDIDYFYVDTEHIWTIDEALVWSRKYENRYLRRNDSKPNFDDFPPTFVAWFYDYQGVSLTDNLDLIEKAGYEVKDIGNTYLSRVVLCDKSNHN